MNYEWITELPDSEVHFGTPNNLALCQLKLQKDPMNVQLMAEEMESSNEVRKWTLARNNFMHQRSKCKWLTFGL